MPVIIIFFPQNSLLSLWPSRPPGAIRLLPPSLPRGGKHHGHLHGHPVPWHRLLCQQRRLEGHLGSHPKGGPAHCVLWGAQGVGEGPGENDPGEKMQRGGKLKGEFRLGKPTLVSRKPLEVGQRRLGWNTTRPSWAAAMGPSSPSRLPTRWCSARWQLWVVKLLYHLPQVKEELGFGHTHSFFSAAAPISRDVLDYFMSLDIKVFLRHIGPFNSESNF